MRIIITGATGFIGRALTARLIEHSHDVIALTRKVNKAKRQFDNNILCVEWDGKTTTGWQKYADETDAIVNLAGRNIGASLWTKSVKEDLRRSRLDAGQAIVQAINQAQKKPSILIQASAIGYYGSSGEEDINEESSKGEGFLADLVEEWENSTQEVEALEVRRVIIRTGLVLGFGGGVLAKMLLPFRFFIGGPVGGGKQWMSWIHMDDQINAIQQFIEQEKYNGIYNLTTSNPVTMREFCKHLGKAMKRPSWLPVPAFALKLMLKEMAEETVLTSQRVFPQRLVESDYSFIFADIDNALDTIIRKE